MQSAMSLFLPVHAPLIWHTVPGLQLSSLLHACWQASPPDVPPPPLLLLFELQAQSPKAQAPSAKVNPSRSDCIAVVLRHETTASDVPLLAPARTRRFSKSEARRGG